MTEAAYRELAETAWRWVLDQVRWDGGPRIPASVPEIEETPGNPNGMHSGIGGLALTLADIRLVRPWTDEERSLADAIAHRLRAAVRTESDCTYFQGLVSTIGALTALGVPGAADAVHRLRNLATPDGWPQTIMGPPRCLPGARINDVVLGTAGVLLGALWARRADVAAAGELADRAAEVLLAEAEPVPTGLNWQLVSPRFRTDASVELPNLSHGVAGVATALALAGAELDRTDLVSAARRGAEHLVTLGTVDGRGFVVPHRVSNRAEVAYGWCHGGTGTSLLFLALDHADVAEIAGESPIAWHRRCLHGVATSGLPARRYPGFWDNDGRCCGTAGVGEVFLDSWLRAGDGDDLAFALHLADTLAERAVRDGPHAYWRFLEHRAAAPLLPPGVGWMQGAAGIAAFLFRISRVVRDGPAAAVVPRMDTWWALGQRDVSSPSSWS